MRQAKRADIEAGLKREVSPPVLADVLGLPMQRGRYVFRDLIGRGGMARVHLAERVGARDFTQYAAKRILPEYADDPRFLNMFWSEARICAALDHPNIVRVEDFGTQDGELVLIMEHMDGVSVSQLLRFAARQGERIPVGVALFIATEVLDALEYAHGVRKDGELCLGVVHRDVSPGNVLVSASTGNVKLTDFGVARSSESPRDTRPGMFKGKFGYMSPEQIGGWDVDRRSDLFSLGVVLFEMLTGAPLFSGRTDYEVLTRTYEADVTPLLDPSRIPLELRLALATSLARNPRERHARAGDFSDALRAFARHSNMTLGPAALISWLESLEIRPSRSGTYLAVRPETTGDGQSDSLRAFREEPDTLLSMPRR
jgi:serine/threonine protein kinase